MSFKLLETNMIICAIKALDPFFIHGVCKNIMENNMVVILR